MALDSSRSGRDAVAETATDSTVLVHEDSSVGDVHEDSSVGDVHDDSSVGDVHDDSSVSNERVTTGELAVTPDGDATTLRATWTAIEQGEATFVSVLVENETPVARRIRLYSRLDGPVMPPRSAGVPETGWDDSGYEGVLEPSERLSLGYATPAEPEDPPVALADQGRAASDRGPMVDAETAVRRLGRASPPRDAVPTVDRSAPAVGRNAPAAEHGPAAAHDASTDSGVCARDDCGHSTETHAALGGRTDESDSPDDQPESTVEDGSRERADGVDSELPQAIEAWLGGAERRIERGEQLSAGSLSEAADVLSAVGGVDGVATLPDQLAGDARALRALARRASALATRAEAVNVPVESLRRLT